MSEPGDPYRILFVCTANICRSPAAEALARARFGERDALFRSAGFLDAGRRCPDFMLQALEERRIDARGHASYVVDVASLRVADLVLTMEGEHVQRATTIDRASFAKIIPLKEAAHSLARANGPQPISAFIDDLNRNRDPTTYLSTQWDVADPYRRKMKDYRSAVDEIALLVEGVIGRLS